MCVIRIRFVFFFNDTATTEIYTLSLHDALPILRRRRRVRLGAELGAQDDRHEDDERHDHDGHERVLGDGVGEERLALRLEDRVDRKSTRLNSSHANISYAVFCLKKKTTAINHSR